MPRNAFDRLQRRRLLEGLGNLSMELSAFRPRQVGIDRLLQQRVTESEAVWPSPGFNGPKTRVDELLQTVLSQPRPQLQQHIDARLRSQDRGDLQHVTRHWVQPENALLDGRAHNFWNDHISISGGTTRCHELFYQQRDTLACCGNLVHNIRGNARSSKRSDQPLAIGPIKWRQVHIRGGIFAAQSNESVHPAAVLAQFFVSECDEQDQWQSRDSSCRVEDEFQRSRISPMQILQHPDRATSAREFLDCIEQSLVQQRSVHRCAGCLGCFAEFRQDG